MRPNTAFHHDSPAQSKDIEDEYDRLRDLARKEHSKRQECFDRAHEAYESGDGAKAHELSETGKRHAAKMDDYNKQASEFIFRENNAEDRVAGDEIDLHGQFMEEAEDILEERIRYAQQHGQTHLHVIVGRGNHSVNHVQKLKPRCEKVCSDLGLQFRTEDNAGRIYVDLTGGDTHLPEHLGGGGQRPTGSFHSATHNRPQQQQHQQQQHQQHQHKPSQQSQKPAAGAASPEHHAQGHSYADAVSGEPHAAHEEKPTKGNYQQQQQHANHRPQEQFQQEENEDVDQMLRKGKKIARALKSCCVVM